MKTPIAIVLAGFAAAALAAPSTVESPAASSTASSSGLPALLAVTQDPVAASFRRMLEHTPTPTVLVDPQALARADADPLRRVNAALWRMDPSWHHVEPQLAASTPASR
ncbi:MAG: hypothetical protein KJ011_13305 [Burkholderiaceae bacterium]|nr:hypothetical protein [Burkholderiaceae bacterium]